MRSNMLTGIEDDEEERYDQGTINKVPGDLDTERGGDAQSRETGWSQPDRGKHDRDIFSPTHFKSGMIIRPSGKAGINLS